MSAFTSRCFSDRGCQPFAIAVDVNPTALEATQKTFKCVGKEFQVECILGDGTTRMLRSNLFDLMLCNPPYVPADRAEIDHPLTAAWAGGFPDGREVTDKVITSASSILMPRVGSL